MTSSLLSTLLLCFSLRSWSCLLVVLVNGMDVVVIIVAIVVYCCSFRFIVVVVVAAAVVVVLVVVDVVLVDLVYYCYCHSH